MASDPSDTSSDRAGTALDGPPHTRILPQVTPREGWTGNQRPAIEELCKFVVGRYPNADRHVLRGRLALLLTNTVGIVAVGQPEGVKPATFVRNAITQLRTVSPDEAVEMLLKPEPVLRNYLDLLLEAEDAENEGPRGPDLASKERAERRLTCATDLQNDALPQPCRGAENPWATVADWVAQLLADVTGKEPTRSWNDYAQADTGWSLSFFQLFAKLALPDAEPPRLDRVWRNVVENRRRK